MADYYLRNMLDEEVSVTVKYNSAEDAQYWKNRPQLDLRRNVASQRDFKTVDALFGEKIAVNHVDPTTIEFMVPAHSMINIGVDYATMCLTRLPSGTITMTRNSIMMIN